MRKDVSRCFIQLPVLSLLTKDRVSYLEASCVAVGV